jgi:hypothetical protein
VKKGTKIVLGVGCGLLLIGAVVIVVGLVAVTYIDKRVRESTAESEQRGREYGQTTDQKGCMDEGMRKSRSIGLLDLGDGIKLSAFVDACLEASRPTQDFCHGVPSFWSLKETEWGQIECRRAGIDPDKTSCLQVTKRKHEYCTKPF